MNLKEQIEQIDGITLAEKMLVPDVDIINICIEGDENDGDYISSENTISLKELLKLIPIIKKIMGYKKDTSRYSVYN